jgi:hypothetical protein
VTSGVRAGIRRWSTTSLSAFALYCLVAFLYFGLRLLVEPGSQYVGYGTDPEIFIWSFAWWPHAILNGQNPFFTHAIWAPSGVNLVWTTSVPGLALLFSPLTLAFGAIASYNVAATLLPAFAAWTAFLLCRHLTRSFWPSLVGGYLFGFSSYMLSQEEGHLHLTSVFIVPLVALVVVRYLEGELDARGLVVRLAPLLGFEVLLSTEVAFTLALALVLALALGSVAVPARRRRIASLVPALAVASALAAAVLAPFLYYALSGYQSTSFNSPKSYDADVLNYLVPTKLSLASLRWAASIATHFPGNDSERGAWLGYPALLIVALYARRRSRTQTGRFLLAALALAVFLSLGNEVFVNGYPRFWLPWSLIVDDPLFDNVLTVRLVMYVSLAVAVIVALWTASRPRGLLRWVLPALAMIALLPNPAAGVWATTFTVPSFFTSSSYRPCLGRGETILPFPISAPGLPMLWQAEDAFRFRMAGGEIAPAPPPSFVSTREANVIAQGYPIPPNQAGLLRSFIQEKGVTAVVIDEGDAGRWSLAMNTIATPHYLGGVIVYRVGSTGSCFGA